MKSCFFIGHYSLPKGSGLIELRQHTEARIKKIFNSGCDTFFTSLTFGGFNVLAAEIIISLKEKGMPIKLVIVHPFKGYENSLDRFSKERAERILAAADKIIFTAQKIDYSNYFSATADIFFEQAELVVVYAAWIDPYIMLLIERAQKNNLKTTILDLFLPELNPSLKLN